MTKKRFVIFKIIAVLVVASFFVISSSAFRINTHRSSLKRSGEQNDVTTEYWALIIGVDCYHGPVEEISSFAVEAYKFYNTLLVSDHWKEDHIKLILDEQATKKGIIDGFKWLRRVADKDDVVLIIYTAHGGYLERDYFPFDEKDGKDEFLTTYNSVSNPLDIIRDDLFKFLLNRIRSNHICVIIDSCYSGGIPDIRSVVSSRVNIFKNLFSPDYKAAKEKWFEGFSNDIQKDGMILLLSCKENEEASGAFVKGVIQGLKGYADKNIDGICSAEEAYEYSYELVVDYPDCDEHPILIDNYPGELLLTFKDLPPETPVICGPQIARVNETFIFCAFSTDPEGDKIEYGWNWNLEYLHRGNYLDIDEWSDLYDSGEQCKQEHIWKDSGIFFTRARARDCYGAEKLHDYWSNYVTTIVLAEDEIIDQWQIKSNYNIIVQGGTGEIVAQSFKPTVSTVSKVKLELSIYCNASIYPLNVSIRETLDGEDLAAKSVLFETEKEQRMHDFWVDFKFDHPLALIPENTYYIVLETSYDGSKDDNVVIHYYKYSELEEDLYDRGSYFKYRNEWKHYEDYDQCFITYE